jgi:hypothetical protein
VYRRNKMSSISTKIDLPLATNATVGGPILEYHGMTVLLKYDHEENDGAIKWASVKFEGVLACHVVQDVAESDPESVIPSREIRCRTESELLTKLLDHWDKMVGWHEYQKRLGGRARFRHYQLFFDDACSVQVVALSCKVE